MTEQQPIAEKDARLVEAVKDVCWRAQRYGETKDGDTAYYLVTKGAMHRLVAACPGAAFRSDDSATIPDQGAEKDVLVEYGADVPMPYHLDLDNPALSTCSGCGRSTWSASEIGQTCGMPQPSGARCDGTFPARGSDA